MHLVLIVVLGVPLFVEAANPITWSQLITPAGVAIAAPLITGLVQLLKSQPAIDRRFSGATLAFLASAVLYLLAAVALQPLTSDGYLNLFATWIGCGLAAVGVYSTAQHLADVTGH